MKIEVCVASLEDAKKAEQLCADRIELCAELGVGGITPSMGLVEQLLEEIEIPIHVLVRPRSGNFNYSTKYFEVIMNDIVHLKKLNVDGIVVGITNENDDLAVPQLKEMRALAGGTPLTFHRAFDLVNNPLVALETLIDIGYSAVLSGGQCEKARDGFDLLKQMNSIAGNTIDILPGGGINGSNCQAFKNEQFRWIHLSAKKETPLINKGDKNLSFLKQVQYELDQGRLEAVVRKCK
jgi:copper homeostasis protein